MWNYPFSAFVVAPGPSPAEPFCCWPWWPWSCGRLSPRNCTRCWAKIRACSRRWGWSASRIAVRLSGACRADAGEILLEGERFLPFDPLELADSASVRREHSYDPSTRLIVATAGLIAAGTLGPILATYAILANLLWYRSLTSLRPQLRIFNRVHRPSGVSSAL